MPSIAAYVNEILAEPMYGSEYIKRIDQRVDAFNAAQLTGINNHITKTAKNAKFHIWKSANEEVITKIAGTLKVRVAAQQKIINEREAAKLLKRQKEQKKLAKKAEATRVLRDILKSALEKAKQEVKVEEQIRQTLEKTEISHKVFEMEAKKWRYLRYLFIGFLIFFIVPCIIVSQWYILVPVLIFVTGFSCYLAYRFHMMTIIMPYDMTQDELNNKISERQVKLKAEALETLQEKEQKFQEMVLRDKIERRIGRLKRKREALEKAKIEFEKRKAWEEQQRQMALEVRTEEDARRQREEEESSDDEEVDSSSLTKKIIDPPPTEVDGPYKFYLSSLVISPGSDLVQWNKPVYGTISLSMSDHEVLHKSFVKNLIGKSISYSQDEFESFSRYHRVDGESKFEGLAPVHHNSNGSDEQHHHHHHHHHHHFHNGLVLHLQSHESIVFKIYTTAKYEKVIILGEVRLTANTMRQAALARVNEELFKSPGGHEKTPWNGEIYIKCPLVWMNSSSPPRGTIDVFGFDHDVYRYFLERIAIIREELASTSQTQTVPPMVEINHTVTPETKSSNVVENDHHVDILDATASRPIRLIRLEINNITDSFLSKNNIIHTGQNLPYRLFMSLEGNDEVLLFGHENLILLNMDEQLHHDTCTITEFSSYDLMLSSEMLLRFKVYFLPLGDPEAKYDISSAGVLDAINNRLILIGECELFGDEILCHMLETTRHLKEVNVEATLSDIEEGVAIIQKNPDKYELNATTKPPQHCRFDRTLEEGIPPTVSGSISVVMESLSDMIFMSDL